VFTRASIESVSGPNVAWLRNRAAAAGVSAAGSGGGSGVGVGVGAGVEGGGLTAVVEPPPLPPPPPQAPRAAMVKTRKRHLATVLLGSRIVYPDCYYSG
jgi:hypothetical protein